jgi:hypothetical protein
VAPYMIFWSCRPAERGPGPRRGIWSSPWSRLVVSGHVRHARAVPRSQQDNYRGRGVANAPHRRVGSLRSARRSRLSKRTSSTRWRTRPTIRQRVLGVGFPGHGCGHPMAKHDPPASGTVRVGPVRALPQPPPRAEGQRRKRSRAAGGFLAQQQLQAAGAGAAGPGHQTAHRA